MKREIAARVATFRAMTALIEHARIAPSPCHPTTARPPHRPGRHLLAASLGTCLMACVASCASPDTPQATATPRGATSGTVAYARFDEQGHAMRPIDWRKWVYVGTPLTPNALNKGKAAFPEFHNVYIEPGAYESFMKT